ncbi:hypothetical protein [Terrabacter sp. Root85]|uniref:hypothetical protein n=1 Tax=Terrabacter sp. Root85 TaxID=1736603 RepID=UPI0006F4A890|nr:hypothetical protein [Terrabacter sp. Root85]
MTLAGRLAAGGAVLVAAGALSGCVQPVRHPPAAPAATTVAVPGCPPVVVTPVQRAIVDFTDFVVHDGVTYSSRPDRPQALAPAQLGPEVFRVSCTYSSLNEHTQSELPEATEHSAGFIPARSPVFELKGWSAACRLAAQHDGRWYVYLATVDTPDASRVEECALDPGRWTQDERS